MSSLIVQSINQLSTANTITDAGSSASGSGSFWSPDLALLGTGPDQYYHGGLFATSNYDQYANPTGPLFAFQMNDSGGELAVSAPTGFSQVWVCSGGSGSSTIGFFNPIAPNGYITVGSIVVQNFNTPPNVADYPNLMCVRQDLCQKVTLTQIDQVWCDIGSGAGQNVIVWKLPYSGAMYAIHYTENQGYPSTDTAYDIVLPT